MQQWILLKLMAIGKIFHFPLGVWIDGYFLNISLPWWYFEEGSIQYL